LEYLGQLDRLDQRAHLDQRDWPELQVSLVQLAFQDRQVGDFLGPLDRQVQLDLLVLRVKLDRLEALDQPE